MSDSLKKRVLSDFSKKSVLECFRLMEDYIHQCETIPDEEDFANMWAGMEIYRISIPKDIFGKLKKFVDDYLAPMTFDPENTFDISNHEEELLEIAKNNPGSDYCSASYREYYNIVLTLADISQELDKFAMKELYPLLTA